MMDPRRRLGARIQKQRKLLGWTQDGLAVKADLTKVSIVRIESGDVWPDFKNLEAISAALSLAIEDLLDSGREPISAKTQLFEIVAALDELKAQALLTHAKHIAATTLSNAPFRNEALKDDKGKLGPGETG